ncbi:MAG: glycosyltransferase family 2 protein [Actinomycetota bacterium]
MPDRSIIREFTDRWRWPRRRTRLPGKGRLLELVGSPGRTVAARGLGLSRPGGPGPDERLIGLLMIRDEDDILADSLAVATRWFDRILVLDGTGPGPARERTDAILAATPEVVVHLRDEDLDHPVRDGARQYLLAEARARYGTGHWIGVLHGDEFLDQDPRPMLASRNPRRDPSIRVRLAHTFLHTDDRDGWADRADLEVRDRVQHLMWPGVPEARFFFDAGDRDFAVGHHGKVIPTSLRNGPLVDGYVITQYNERDPEQLAARADDRAESQWQREHYVRMDAGIDAAFTSTLDLPGAPFAPEFAGDPEGPFVARHRDDVPIGPLAPPPAVFDAVVTDSAVAFVTEPGGLLDLLDSPGRLAALRWRLRMRGSAHADVPGIAALVRHTAAILGASNVDAVQRRRVAAEFVSLVLGRATPSIAVERNRADAVRAMLSP